MAVATNLPFALAPGLGINAVVAFESIIGRELPWPVGMSVVVIEGVLALVLVVAGLREAIMRAVPLSLKLRSASASGCSSRSSGCARAASWSTTRRPASASATSPAGRR